MLQARAQSGGVRPSILVYSREDDASFDERLRGLPLPAKENLIEQRKLVESFIREEFQDAETKLNLRAFHRFDRPTTFAQRLRIHLQELLDPLAGGNLATPVWDIASKGPPFLGLDAFEFEHAPVFFGREDEIVAVRQLLREQARRGCAFVLITGASGSGKSSLVRAGVLPAIAAHEIDGDVAGWRIAVFTPAAGDGDLLLTLACALSAESALPALCCEPEALARLADDFARDPEMVCRRVLRPALELGRRRDRLLVFVDQLEELFTYQRITEKTREAFVCALEALARSGCAWVLATARSDFYAQCQSLPALVRMKEGGGQFDLVPPGADALDRLIRQPAALAGLCFEQRGERFLADVIVRDATDHRELLPLLEYLLHRLCAERRITDGMLTFASYETLGGVEGALARRADAVIAELRPAESTLDALLASLVTLSGDERESFVRRRVPRGDLERDEASRALVTTLIRERLLTSSAPTDGEAIVTVAHEALFRVWSHAVSWLGRNREFLRVRAHVAERLNQWRSSAPEKHSGGAPKLGDPSFLLQPGRELSDAHEQFARNRVAFNQAEQDFILASLEAAEEKLWRMTLAAGDEDEMRVHWNRLETDYALMRERVLAQLLTDGTANDRRNAAFLVGVIPSRPGIRELPRLLLADEDDAVRRAAAYSLVRLDKIEPYNEITTRAKNPGEEAVALGALARCLVAADMQCYAPYFDAWFGTLPSELRRRTRVHSWGLRLRMALPSFLAVVIPATILAVTGAMVSKFIPGMFNYAFGQARPGGAVAIFHGAVAATAIAGSSAFGLTLYRLVFGREHVRCGFLRPFGAIFAGAIFGGFGGMLCNVAIAGVFLLEGLQIMGWIGDDVLDKPPFLQFFYKIFVENHCGLVFVLNGAGTGIGMAMITNRLRSLARWEQFLEERSATTLSGFRQIGDVLRGLTRLALRYSWPLPASLAATSLLGLSALNSTEEMKPLNPNLTWREAMLGGLVHVEPPRKRMPGQEKTGEETIEVSAAIDKANVKTKEQMDEIEIRTLENLDKQNAQKEQRRKLREWKTSRFGRVIGIACDAMTKAIGGFFGIVGIGFGIVVLRGGINIERRRKVG